MTSPEDCITLVNLLKYLQEREKRRTTLERDLERKRKYIVKRFLCTRFLICPDFSVISHVVTSLRYFTRCYFTPLFHVVIGATFRQELAKLDSQTSEKDKVSLVRSDMQ